MADRVEARPVLLNAALVMLGRVSLLLLGLVSLPVVLHRLGSAAFGIYVLATSLGGLLTLLDLGLNPALIMLVSRRWSHQDQEGMQKVIRTASTLYLLVGLVGAAGIALLAPWLSGSFLHVPSSLTQQADIALRLGAASFAITMGCSVFAAIPVALERYQFLAVRTLALGVVTTVLVIGIALNGGGLIGLTLINLLSGAATGAVFYAFSRKMLPDMRFRPGFDLPSFRALARFSVFKFAGNLGGTLTFRVDQVAIGGLLGVASLGLYAVPFSLCSRAHALIGEMVSPLFPRVSKLTPTDREVTRLFLHGMRAVALVATPLLVALFVFADDILHYWIGGAQGQLVAVQGTTVMRWLLAAFMIQALAAIPCIICEAFGKPEINNGFSVAGGLLHIPLILVLIPSMGITGAGVALFANSIAQTAVFIAFVAHRLVRVSLVEVATRSLARPAIAALLAGAVAWWERPLVHGRLSLLLALAALPLVFVAIAVPIGAVTRSDLAAIRSLTASPSKSFIQQILHPRGSGRMPRAVTRGARHIPDLEGDESPRTVTTRVTREDVGPTI